MTLLDVALCMLGVWSQYTAQHQAFVHAWVVTGQCPNAAVCMLDLWSQCIAQCQAFCMCLNCEHSELHSINHFVHALFVVIAHCIGPAVCMLELWLQRSAQCQAICCMLRLRSQPIVQYQALGAWFVCGHSALHRSCCLYA